MYAARIYTRRQYARMIINKMHTAGVLFLVWFLSRAQAQEFNLSSNTFAAFEDQTLNIMCTSTNDTTRAFLYDANTHYILRYGSIISRTQKRFSYIIRKRDHGKKIYCGLPNARSENKTITVYYHVFTTYQHLRLHIGDSAVVNFTLNGNPNNIRHRLSLRRPGAAHRIYVSGYSVFFNEVEPQDSGYNQLYSSNEIGEIWSFVTLQVTWPIQIYGGPLVVIEGNNMTVTCSGRNTNLQAALQPSSTHVNRTHRVYIWDNVRRSAHGTTVQCAYKRSIAYRSTSVAVTVFYIDNYVFGSSTNITVSEGSSWVLNFTVEANPIIHSNNISLADGRPVSDRITTTQNSVTFREVAQSDAGQYIISTSNKAGTAMSTIHLNLTRDETTQSMTSYLHDGTTDDGATHDGTTQSTTSFPTLFIINSQMSTSSLGSGVIPVVVIVIVIVVIMLLYRNYWKIKNKSTNIGGKLKRSEMNKESPTSMSLNRDQTTHNLSVSEQLIINSSNLELNEAIGQGVFGIVYKGLLCREEVESNEVVAVKRFKGFLDDSFIRGLVKEWMRISKFDHPNVLNIIGVCLDGGPAPYVVMPFMSNGSLLSYLKKRRKKFVVLPDAEINEEVMVSARAKLLGICLQVCKGMEYLSSQGVVHGNLACRNCMIDSNFTIKVSDFGLFNNVDLPVKWLAPESLSDGIFSEKTDVWAFGVTYWEVYSGGKIPYAAIHPMELPGMIHDGYKLDKPSNLACSDKVYEIMTSCWEINSKDRPSERPSFSDLVVQLSYLVNLPGYALANIGEE